jgi:hypothetical protein
VESGQTASLSCWLLVATPARGGRYPFGSEPPCIGGCGSQRATRPANRPQVRVSGCKKYTITRTYKNNLRFLADIWLGTEISRANLSRMHFVSGCNFGLLLINLCKELPYIGNQEIGLLQSREMSALRHPSFLYYDVCLSNLAKRRDSHFLRKIRIPLCPA